MLPRKGFRPDGESRGDFPVDSSCEVATLSFHDSCLIRMDSAAGPAKGGRPATKCRTVGPHGRQLRGHRAGSRRQGSPTTGTREPRGPSRDAAVQCRLSSITSICTCGSGPRRVRAARRPAAQTPEPGFSAPVVSTRARDGPR